MPTRLRRAPAALLVAVAGPAACGNGPAAPVGPLAAAVASRSCAPTDGAAVRIILAPTADAARDARPPYVTVSVYTAPRELAGRSWRVADGSDEGLATRVHGADAYENAVRGTVAVRRVSADTTIEGTVDARFPSGARVRQPFRATWRPTSAPAGVPFCG
jgi:hypothetical protein